MSVQQQSKNEEIYLTLNNASGTHRVEFYGTPTTEVYRAGCKYPLTVLGRLVDVNGNSSKLLSPKIYTQKTMGEVELIKEVKKVLCNEMNLAFFRIIARKPHLWSAWENDDFAALVEEAPQYVMFNEFIDVLHTDVMKTERLRRPRDGNPVFFNIKATKRVRFNYQGNTFVGDMKYTMLSPKGQLQDMRLEVSLSPVQSSAEVRRKLGFLILEHIFCLEDIPGLTTWTKDSRIEPILSAWASLIPAIDNNEK